MLVNLAPNLPLRIQVRIKCLTSHYNLTPQLLAITGKGNTSSVHRLWLWNLNHETNKSISTSQLGLSLFSLMMMIRPWRTSSVLPADPPPSTQQSTYRWRQCSRHSPTDTAAVLIITQKSVTYSIWPNQSSARCSGVSPLIGAHRLMFEWKGIFLSLV